MDKTINVVSTPNISGNIGSCETKSVETAIDKGILIDRYQVILTNSCTGQIINTYNYEDRGFWMWGIVLWGVVIVIAIFTLILIGCKMFIKDF